MSEIDAFLNSPDGKAQTNETVNDEELIVLEPIREIFQLNASPTAMRFLGKLDDFAKSNASGLRETFDGKRLLKVNDIFAIIRCTTPKDLAKNNHELIPGDGTHCNHTWQFSHFGTRQVCRLCLFILHEGE